MTQNECIKAIAHELGVHPKVAKHYLDVLAELTLRTVRRNDTFVLPGIGKITVTKRAKRIGRNPKTGEPLVIPAKRVIKFRVAGSLKAAL